MAQPSPISTTPAFSSPALTRISGPVVGNFFSSFFEFLYEQCSLHITEKIPNAVKFGSRPRIFLMRSNSSGVRPCCLTSSGVTAGSAVGISLVIGRFTLTNLQARSITQIRIFIKSSHFGSVQHIFQLRTLGVSINNREASMVKKAIVALACVLIASPAFAQTTTKRTRHHRTTTALTTVEGVTVTAPIIGVEGGSAASYQPAGTLVIRTDSANPERFDMFGPGLIFDKMGREVRTPIKPGTRDRVFYADLGATRTV